MINTIDEYQDILLGNLLKVTRYFVDHLKDGDEIPQECLDTLIPL